MLTCKIKNISETKIVDTCEKNPSHYVSITVMSYSRALRTEVGH